MALRSHPNARGTERAQAESGLCLGACAVAAVVRARLRTALVEGYLAIVDPLFVARLAAEPLLGGAGRLDVARFIGTRAGRKKSEHSPCNDKKPGTPPQIFDRTSETAAHELSLTTPRLLTVSSMLPPHFPRRRLQRLMNFGALSRGFGTCCLRFKNDVATIPARLTSGWLARLCREGVDPLDRCKRFQVIHPPFLDLAWRKGSFIWSSGCP